MNSIKVGKQCSFCNKWNYLNIVGYKPEQTFKAIKRCRCGNYLRWTEADMGITNFKINEEKT